jgi:hypothetical protein
MKFLVMIFFFALSALCLGQEPFQAIRPFADNAEKVERKDDLVWNKWDTENFVVLSLDKSQGLKLKGLLEKTKDSVSKRWSLGIFKFPTPCKVMCVPSQELLSKLFNIDSPHVEIRRDANGNVSLCAIWMTFEDVDYLPFLVSSVCVADGICPNKQSWAVQRGISCLNKPLDQIRVDISDLDSFNSKIFDMTKEKWLVLSSKDKQKFDSESLVACLLLRKEFGGVAFSKFVSESPDKTSLVKSLYGFKDLDHFESVLERYAKNLSEDIRKGRTPDSYLMVISDY